jgi:outer membrane protein TolC
MSTRVSRTFRVSIVTALAAVVALAGAAHAQSPQVPAVPSGPLTLEQVLSIAEARSESVGIAQVAVTRTEGDAVRARAAERPQLSAAASYDRSLANEFQGVFDNIDFGNGGNDGSTGTDDGSLADLPFGRANTWRASLSFSQNVYSGGRIGVQKQLATLGRTSAEQALVGARAQLRFDVTQAYYDALLSERLVTIAQATLDQAGATLKQTQAGLDAGTQPEFEVLRATVSRDNQTPVLIRQRANRDVAMLRLKQLLELPVDYDLRLADDLGDPRLAPAPVFAERVAPVEAALRTTNLVATQGAPMPERNAVAEAGTVVTLREAALKAVQAERMPSVSFTSNYSRIAYPTGALPVFDRSNWSVGVAMSVPILTGGRQKGDEMVARADIETARLQEKQAQELAALETRSAWAELVAARAAWEATAGTVQQANRAYEIADVRYRAGVSTQLELSDSRLLLQQAEANRALAARDVQVARARVALLPELPLGAGTTGAARTTTGSQGTQPAAPQQQQQG